MSAATRVEHGGAAEHDDSRRAPTRTSDAGARAPELATARLGADTSDAGARAPELAMASGAVALATEAAAEVDRLACGVPAQQQALQAAKETAEPWQIRLAASGLERTRVLLLVQRDMIRRALPALPSNLAQLDAAEQRADQLAGELAEPIARARAQAGRLGDASGGSLAQLPRGEAATSPEELRAQAVALAPPGLCDDPTMQSLDSPVCPLRVEEREALRDVVAARLEQIADNWQSAADQAYVDKRLEPLLERGGLHPLVEILLGVAAEWAGGRIAGMALRSLSRVRAPRATRGLPKPVAPVALDPRAFKAPAPDPEEVDTALSTFAAKLIEQTGKGGVAAGGDDVKALFGGVTRAVAAWKMHATIDVRQLPDPTLVELGKGLESARYDVAFFAAKLEQLLAGFARVQAIGVVLPGALFPLEPAWVIDPTGEARLALVRKATRVIPTSVSGAHREAANWTVEQPTGKLVFEGWVDRSLTSIALGRQQPTLVLTMADARWQTPPAERRGPGEPRTGDQEADVEMLAIEDTAKETP